MDKPGIEPGRIRRDDRSFPPCPRTHNRQNCFRVRFPVLIREGRHAGSRTREICAVLLELLALKLSVAAENSRSPGGAGRQFRRFQGTSPYHYLLRRKMNLAPEFLIDQGCLVKEAAMRVGFADPFHFSRCFKAVHGVAPSELQRQMRERGGRSDED